MGISVILLAYKEEENLKILLPKIKHQLENIGERYEIIVVDTKIPTDKTADICEENSVKYINQEEPHFAGAFRTGIKYALMDKFLILDSDGSHDPQYIPQIYYRFIKGNDVVIGSRYTKGGQTSDAKSSILMSKILNNVFRICLGIDAKDISTDFRMYHTMQLKGLDLECENYDVLQEV
ncbi:MAG: glycosyltransferase family 2 protein, partial [Oscillospiraceae bacterium]